MKIFTVIAHPVARMPFKTNGGAVMLRYWLMRGGRGGSKRSTAPPLPKSNRA
jgi:hypothetical protein